MKTIFTKAAHHKRKTTCHMFVICHITNVVIRYMAFVICHNFYITFRSKWFKIPIGRSYIVTQYLKFLVWGKVF